MDLMSEQELFENAHNAGVDALNLEERLLLNELVSKIVLNDYLMLIMLTGNEDDTQIWWNKYAPYYKAFIIYLAKQGKQYLLKEPNINLDVKNEQIYVNYRLTCNAKLEILPSSSDMLKNCIILTEF
jgi:hypothetical protein